MSVYEERDFDIVKSVRDGITGSIGEENLIYMQDLSQDEIARYYYLVDEDMRLRLEVKLIRSVMTGFHILRS